MKQQADPKLKPFIDKYKDVLRQAGREVVEQSRLSVQTIEELNKPLIPFDQYINTANKFFDWIIKKSEGRAK